MTNQQEQDGVELSAGDEQLLRELTERARAGEGGLLGRLTKMMSRARAFALSHY